MCWGRTPTPPKVRLLEQPEELWWYRLSLKLGEPVNRLKAEVTPAQLQMYKAVALIDGPWWGSEADAIYTADVVHTLACCHAQTPPKWGDVLRRWGDPPKRQTLSFHEATPILTSFVKG